MDVGQVLAKAIRIGRLGKGLEEVMFNDYGIGDNGAGRLLRAMEMTAPWPHLKRLGLALCDDEEPEGGMLILGRMMGAGAFPHLEELSLLHE